MDIIKKKNLNGALTMTLLFSILVLFQNCTAPFQSENLNNQINNPNSPYENPYQNDPIIVEPKTWSFIPVESSKCANGSETGFGFYKNPNSKKIMIYFQGGGSCASGANCWDPVNPGAANLNGYNQVQFENESQISNYVFLSDDQASQNPFLEMNKVLIPYCTGDAHTGSAQRALSLPDGSTKQTYFMGRSNLKLYLKKIHDTFPEIEEVWLVGTSAGGAGANANYKLIKDTLKTQVHLIVDSATGAKDEGDENKWALWGTELNCGDMTCSSPDDIRKYNRTLDPNSRYAFISFKYDATAANGRSEIEFGQLIDYLVEDIQFDTNSKTFIVDNASTGFSKTLHVVTTKNKPAEIRNMYVLFVEQMVKNLNWNSQTIIFNP